MLRPSIIDISCLCAYALEHIKPMRLKRNVLTYLYHSLPRWFGSLNVFGYVSMRVLIACSENHQCVCVRQNTCSDRFDMARLIIISFYL